MYLFHKSLRLVLFVFASFISVALLLVACGQSTPPSNAPSSNFHTSAKTSDSLLNVTLDISPNRVGQNTFTVHVTGTDGKMQTQDSVSVDVTMLSMNMGTQVMPLQSDGKGGYTASGSLGMTGSYQLRIAVHTPDHTLHTATLNFSTTS